MTRLVALTRAGCRKGETANRVEDAGRGHSCRGYENLGTLWDVAAVPDPVRVSIVGVLAASLMKEMFPDARPLVRGVKVSVNDVLWPGAIVVGKCRTAVDVVSHNRRRCGVPAKTQPAARTPR